MLVRAGCGKVIKGMSTNNPHNNVILWPQAQLPHPKWQSASKEKVAAVSNLATGSQGWSEKAASIGGLQTAQPSLLGTGKYRMPSRSGLPENQPSSKKFDSTIFSKNSPGYLLTFTQSHLGVSALGHHSKQYPGQNNQWESKLLSERWEPTRSWAKDRWHRVVSVQVSPDVWGTDHHYDKMEPGHHHKLWCEVERWVCRAEEFSHSHWGKHWSATPGSHLWNFAIALVCSWGS